MWLPHKITRIAHYTLHSQDQWFYIAKYCYTGHFRVYCILSKCYGKSINQQITPCLMLNLPHQNNAADYCKDN